MTPGAAYPFFLALALIHTRFRRDRISRESSVKDKSTNGQKPDSPPIKNQAAAEMGRQGRIKGGAVEVNSFYVGRCTKQANVKADRVDHWLTVPVKRQSVVVARQRGCRTLPFVVAKEADGVALIR